MYRYIARPSILHKYKSIKKTSKIPWDDLYHLAVKIAGDPESYFLCGRFWDEYKKMNFYSKTKRLYVPLNGVMIPVQWFLEIKIDD